MTATPANPPVPFPRRLVSSAYRNRRRLATCSAMMLAALLGYYAVAGDNGITIYKQKRIEDRQLAKRIEDLKQENTRLQAHVERLKSDPDAIEHEARNTLHYARPGEVIYTLRDAPDATRSAAPAANANPATPSSASTP